jgi:hypothetical protein
MNVRFPKGDAVIETTKRDRDVLRNAQGLCRHAGLIPGNKDLADAALAIEAFLADQEGTTAEVVE